MKFISHRIREMAENSKKKNDQQDKHQCNQCYKSFKHRSTLLAHTKLKHTARDNKKQKSIQQQSNLSEEVSKISETVQQNEDLYLEAFRSLFQCQNGYEQESYKLQSVLSPFVQKQQLLRKQKILPRDTNIDEKFVALLDFLVQKVPLARLQQLCVVLLVWRQCIYKNWILYQKQRMIQDPQSRFMCYIVLRAMNDVYLEQFPSIGPLYLGMLKDVKLFRPKRYGIVLCKMMMLVSRWMYWKGYIQKKVQYNQE